MNRISSGGDYTLVGGAFRSQWRADVDNDGVDDDLEDLGLNGGDGNDDGIQDSIQSHVVTVAGDNTTHAVALEVTSTGCATVAAFSDKTESMLASDDSGYTYPIGLIDFRLGC